MRKDVDDATMVRVDLERKIETLHEELDYSRKVRLEEVEDLKQQISEQGLSVEVDGITPDMNQILNEIRKEYDVIALKNRDEAEMWYKVNIYDEGCASWKMKFWKGLKTLKNDLFWYKNVIFHRF